jgi:hypothetical protein
VTPRGPSRARARPGWVGSIRKNSPIVRECPKCPAEPYRRCHRWTPERYTAPAASGGLFQGEGRWVRMDGLHDARESPGRTSRGVPKLMAAQRLVCDRPGQHGYHWVTEEVIWCRGRMGS